MTKENNKNVNNNIFTRLNLTDLLNNKQARASSKFTSINVIYYITNLIEKEDADKMDCQGIAGRAIIRIINTGNLNTSLEYITTHTCKNRQGADKTGGQEKPEEFKGADLLKDLINKTSFTVPAEFINTLKQDPDIAKAIENKSKKTSGDETTADNE